MTKSNSALAVSGLVLATVAGLTCMDAQAVEIGRRFSSNATGLCQGALPAFETAIRKRPLAVQNEGASTAFVTCSFTSQGSQIAGGLNPATAAIFFTSQTGDDVTINCTGVSGRQNSPNEYIPKSVVVGGATGAIEWLAADFSGAPARFPSGLFSVSCSLPPGAAILDTRVVFFEEIGD